jgi:hypothetical protein
MSSYSIRQVQKDFESSQFERIGDVIEVSDAPTAQEALDECVARLKLDKDKFEAFRKADLYGAPWFESENTQDPTDVARRPADYEEGGFSDDEMNDMDDAWDEIAEEDNNQP